MTVGAETLPSHLASLSNFESKAPPLCWLPHRRREVRALTQVTNNNIVPGVLRASKIYCLSARLRQVACRIVRLTQQRGTRIIFMPELSLMMLRLLMVAICLLQMATSLRLLSIKPTRLYSASDSRLQAKKGGGKGQVVPPLPEFSRILNVGQIPEKRPG
jgi:hypothetical protein